MPARDLDWIRKSRETIMRSEGKFIWGPGFFSIIDQVAMRAGG